MKLITLCTILFCASMAQAQAAAMSADGMTADELFKAVGGDYDHQIANFKGFLQEGMDWCWAATTKTIYYNLTGAELDQAQLARINFSGPPESGNSWGSDISSVDKKKCKATEAHCNHGGWAQVALSELGAAIPFERRPLDAPSRLSLIRESLDHNVPVGIVVRKGADRLHEVVVYGAHFSLARKQDNSEEFEMTLDVFDPGFITGGHELLVGTTYAPLSDGENAGEWTGEVDAADSSVRNVNKSACPFLKLIDKIKFCVL